MHVCRCLHVRLCACLCVCLCVCVWGSTTTTTAAKQVYNATKFHFNEKLLFMQPYRDLAPATEKFCPKGELSVECRVKPAWANQT